MSYAFNTSFFLVRGMGYTKQVHSVMFIDE